MKGIRLRGGTPSNVELQMVLDAVRSDPKLRANLIRNAKDVIALMNSGQMGMNDNRAAKMHFLIKALEKMK